MSPREHGTKTIPLEKVDGTQRSESHHRLGNNWYCVAWQNVLREDVARDIVGKGLLILMSERRKDRQGTVRRVGEGKSCETLNHEAHLWVCLSSFPPAKDSVSSVFAKVGDWQMVGLWLHMVLDFKALMLHSTYQPRKRLGWELGKSQYVCFQVTPVPFLLSLEQFARDHQSPTLDEFLLLLKHLKRTS